MLPSGSAKDSTKLFYFLSWLVVRGFSPVAYKSLLVTCSFGHLRIKIATHMRSAELKLGSVQPQKCVNEII